MIDYISTSILCQRQWSLGGGEKGRSMGEMQLATFPAIAEDGYHDVETYFDSDFYNNTHSRHRPLFLLWIARGHILLCTED